jgi:hypothetical protein
MKRLLLVGVLLMAMFPMSAAARGRGGVFIGPSFGFYGVYGGWGPWGSYYGMYPYGPSNFGQVKIDTGSKDAAVFINGHFAGTVGQLKTMTMRSGDYDIEVREPGRQPFQAQIFVVPGKTMKLRPDRIPAMGGPAGS